MVRTFVASNPAGTVDATLTITVNDLPLRQATPKALSASPSAVQLSSQVGAGVGYSVLPMLPPGIHMNFSTGVIFGTPSAVAPQNVYVTASNSGGFTATQGTISVTGPWPGRASMRKRVDRLLFWRIAFLLCVTLGLLLSRAAEGSGPDPYPGAFASSSDGRWYTIVDPEGTFLLVRRGAGLPRKGGPPPLPAAARAEDVVRLRPDPGDVVVSRGTCGSPAKVVTLRGGRGFVAIDEFGAWGQGRILARFDGKGSESWSRRLGDLFDATTIDRLPKSMDRIYWENRTWLSSREDLLVVIGIPCAVRALDVDSGSSKELSPEVIEDRLGERAWDDLSIFLDCLMAVRPAWLPAASRKALTQASTDRVRMALYAGIGSEATVEEKERFRELLEHAKNPKDREDGLRLLAYLDGDAASAKLLEVVRLGSSVSDGSLEDLVAAVGDPARAELVDIARNTSLPKKSRLLAIRCMAVMMKTSDDMITHLSRLLRDPDVDVANGAVLAMVNSTSPATRRELRKALADPRIDDVPIVEFLIKQGTAEDLAAFVDALRRHPDDKWTRGILTRLKQYSGQDFGASVSKWEAWLKSR